MSAADVAAKVKKKSESRKEALSTTRDSGSDACGTGVQEDSERE
jgi:hypothetical protein